MKPDYEKILGREKLTQILPLGMFCYDVNCRTSRIFIGAVENDCLENIAIQQRVCKKNCKAYRLDLYRKGEKIHRESNINA
jgi:hypothetical protein